MESEKELNPEELFQLFQSAFKQSNAEIGREALKRFDKVRDKSIFLDPTIKFISDESEDEIRGWATTILRMIGEDLPKWKDDAKRAEAAQKAFQSIIELLKRTSSKEEKKRYSDTRFFALKAAKILSTDDDKQGILRGFLTTIWQDEDEHHPVRAEALVILADLGDNESKNKVRDWLKNPRDFRKSLGMLKALREFPQSDLEDEVIAILGSNDYYSDHKYEAILVLGKSPSGDLKVIRKLGEIARTDSHSYFRLQALKSLANLKKRESVFDLLHGLTDTNAENRVQACNALKSTLSTDTEAISIIINEAFNKDSTDDVSIKQYVEALRHIDLDRTVSADILSRELRNEDRKRAQIAEKMLIELGGWVAVQRLNQRRITLDALDKLLNESEIVVKNTFEDTIRQARHNFKFALGVNILVVITGFVLIGIAIKQVWDGNSTFDQLSVGGAGVFGLIINRYFNDPRKNAKEDLTTFMNVNVIFLGFLRQLNEIDATFKHAYLESQNFGIAQMNETVTQIQVTMNKTLILASDYLAAPVIINKTKESPRSIHEDTLSSSLVENPDLTAQDLTRSI
ncbi:MAG: HEAT repeat domain-containing protein [Methanothrix sp.]|nr:HEAT repeat domain-containing protein [Methanothrix sp.]